jgi:hypothetical protein
VIKAILQIYKDSPKDEIDIYGVALKKLSSDFIEQSDPNLRYLGLKCLEDVIDDKTKVLFAAKILYKFQTEKEYSIVNKLTQILR